MSSDSDDDSYTNSVSLLKALTNKNISIDSEIDSCNSNGVNFFDISSEIEPQTPKLTRSGALDESESEDLEAVELTKDVKVTKNNNDPILLSDEELDTTPINIISTIDDILQIARGSKKKVRTSKRILRARVKCSPRRTRQSKRLRKPEEVHILNESDVCIVQDAPDINEINYELTIKVFWKSQNLEKFTMRRFDKLTNIFKHFSNKENTPENRLLFTIKDKIISKNDTPESLNITAATIIEGGILSSKTTLGNSAKQDTDKLEFKVQTKDRKHPLLISLSAENRMEVLMCKCAAELDVAVKTLKFYFDGDLIKSSDTPESLELEGGEIIDCVKI